MVFGVLRPGRTLDRPDLPLAERVAERCAVAIDNAHLYQQAQEAIRGRDQVLEVISHDLRSPLSVVLLGAKALARGAPLGPAGAATRKTCATLERSCGRMASLIKDLTDLAALDAGALSVQRRREDPVAIARDVIEGHRLLADERSIAIGLRTPGHADPVECDRDRIAQVLSNLVENAIHATSSGGAVTLSVEDLPGETVFAVVDTGRGIQPDEMPRLFERRWRGKGAEYAGSGLGLCIAEGIAKGARRADPGRE